MRVPRLPILLVLFALLHVADMPAHSQDLPAGWFKGGRPADNYETGTDTQTRHGESTSVFVRSRTAAPGGFGTIMRVLRAEPYRGKRVRLSAYVKASSIRDWAGVWMRVDPADPDKPFFAFDNMADRPVRGTQDWTRHEIVLDVDPEAALIHFGVLLSGEGSVWMSDPVIEVVGGDVRTTNTMKPASACCGGGDR